MLRDKEGNKLFRRVELKIVYPDNILRPETIVQKSEAHQGFSSDSIDEMLMQVADTLDIRFPWWSFKMTPLAPEHRTARYVFTCMGLNPNYKHPEHQIASPIVVSPNADIPESQPSATSEEINASAAPTV